MPYYTLPTSRSANLALGAQRPELPRRQCWNAGCARRSVRLNLDLPPEALDDAYRKLTRMHRRSSSGTAPFIAC